MDNTWSTFLGCNPLNFGIDIVVESLTKYFSGHSDNFCGIITCSKKYYLDINHHDKYLNYEGDLIHLLFDY